MAEQALHANIELPNKAYLLPDAIPMWPPVWWSWLVMALILILLGCSVFHFTRRYKQRAYRREAQYIIKNIGKDMSDKDIILLCHETIRRCLISEGKTIKAALPSSELFSALDKTLPSKHTFSLLGEDFINGQYRPHINLSEEQKMQILSTTKHWIRKHHA